MLAKVNLRDGFPGGLELDESLQVAHGLGERASPRWCCPAASCRATRSICSRGDRPLSAMIAAERHLPQKVALCLFGPLVVRSYPFEPLYFCRWREFRRALRLPLVLLGGIKHRADIDAALAEGFDGDGRGCCTTRR